MGLSVMKEVRQPHDKRVWTPVSYDSINNKAKIIRSLIFLQRKRDGTLKARFVADGLMMCPHCCYRILIPTCCCICSWVEQVVTVDFEGEFLHGIKTNEIYMEISGQCLDVLIYLYNKVCKDKVYNDRVYVTLNWALYGTIEAAKVWWGRHIVRLSYEIGETLDYLGMLFNFNIPGEVSISTVNMVSEFLTEVGVGDGARAESPACNSLYQVDDKGE